MSKRRPSDEGDDSSDSSTPSLIDVSFDFFDPNPAIDYHAFHRLLTQLFSRDAPHLHIPALTDLVLSQPTVGTTIKTDGIESDPYALLTVLNMHVHAENEGVKAVAGYVLEKAKGDPAFHDVLQGLFGQTEKHVGLVLCERLVNMPVQVVPPMYKMLVDEIGWALNDNEPYKFSHLLFISRAYHLSLDEETALENSASPNRRQPKSKKPRRPAPQNAQRRPQDGIYPFHPEDEVISQASSHTLTYSYTTPPPSDRGKDAFGLDVRGRMMLVPLVDENGGETGALAKLVERMAEVYGSTS